MILQKSTSFHAIRSWSFRNICSWDRMAGGPVFCATLYAFRSKAQRSRSRGHKVQKHIEDDRVTGVGLQLCWMPVVSYIIDSWIYSQLQRTFGGCRLCWQCRSTIPFQAFTTISSTHCDCGRPGHRIPLISSFVRRRHVGFFREKIISSVNDY